MNERPESKINAHFAPMKRGMAVALAATVAGVLGLAVGAWVAIEIASPAPTAVSAGTAACGLDSELGAEVAEVKKDLAAEKTSIESIQADVKKIGESMGKTGAGDTTMEIGPAPDVAGLLAPAFVDKVTAFFATAGPKSLLSSKLKNDPSVVFETPIFIDARTITVPYRAGDQKYYLTVSIQVQNNLYDLEFNPVWDSYEGAKK